MFSALKFLPDKNTKILYESSDYYAFRLENKTKILTM
jgi:hypothetical protein